MEYGHRRLTLPGEGVRLTADRWAPPLRTRRGTVLLLHGGGQTRHSWRHTGRRLAAQGWTAIAFDLRGHGDSDWAPDGDYTLDAHVADLRKAVTVLDEPPVLVGASLGGMTSLLALAADPAVARGLALVDVTPTTERAGTAEITDFMRSGTAGFATLDEAAAAVAAYNPHRTRPPRPEGLKKNLRRRDGRWYWHWDPRLLDARQTDPRTLDENARRAREAARGLAVPTLLVRGRQSRVVSTASAQELLSLVPSARLVDVDGAGHMVAGDDNDVFGEHLLDFLDGPVRLAG
ncbi:alpha/beta fold hydrolase [Pseudonocardia halophobica]|uniref:alpha/beta fold hydrolase n=1 Tax=Pseudonocardia halophobica TaxID=29401 RepID=UPI003D8FE266